MDLRSQLDMYRKEHDDILRFLKEWEGALDLAASADDATRCKGLTQLAEMEKKLLEIRQHCREEEKNIDSPFQIHLDDNAFAQLAEDHALLDELSEGYRSELKSLTTPPPTNDLVGRGRHLLGELRRHIAFEEGLLKQIEDGNEAEEKMFLRYTHSAE